MTRPKTRQESLEEKEYLGEPGAPAQGGVAGGDLQEKKGKLDEMKRAKERPAGVTRVRRSDEKEKD